MKRAVLLGTIAALLVAVAVTAAGGRTPLFQMIFHAAGTGAADRTVFSKLSDVVSVNDFSGATAGAKIQAAHDALTSSGGIVDASMLLGAQTISSTVNITKPVTIRLPPPGSATFTVTSNPAFYVNGTTDVVIQDGKLTLSGVNSAGVKFATVTDLTLDNLTITGSGTLSDAQKGIYSDSGGQVATLLRFKNNTISSVMVAIEIHLNVAGAFALIEGNRLTNIIGTASGQGYGIAFDNIAPNSCDITITNNVIELAQRHSIYHSTCDGGVISNNTIRLHRSGVGATLMRSAIVVDRSQDVTVSGNWIDTPSDGAIEVAADLTTCGALCVSRNITIANNVILNPKLWPAFTVSTSTTTDGYSEGVTFIGNTVYKNVTDSDNTELVDVWQGKRINFIGNMFYLLNCTGVGDAIVIMRGAGETAGTATYTDDVHWRDNQFYMTNNGGSATVPIFWASAAATSAIRSDWTNNRFTVPGSVHAFQVTQTNPNIIINGADQYTGMVSTLFPAVVTAPSPTLALTAQTANLAATSVAATVGAGKYRVCATARTTTSGTGTFAILNIIWTDEGGAKTDAVGSWALNAVDVTGQINKCDYIHAAAATNIQVSVTAGTYGTSVYAISATAERLN